MTNQVERPRESEWQPIETAPLDERVLVWTGNGKTIGKDPVIFAAVLRTYSCGQRLWAITEWNGELSQAPNVICMDIATHWMRLPAPPESDQ